MSYRMKQQIQANFLDFTKCSHCKNNRQAKFIIRFAKQNSLVLCEEHFKKFRTKLESDGKKIIVLKSIGLSSVNLPSSDITPYLAHTERSTQSEKLQRVEQQQKIARSDIDRIIGHDPIDPAWADTTPA